LVLKDIEKINLRGLGNGKAVTALLSKNNQFRLRAMASSPKVRGQGFAKDVIIFALKELQKRETALLWCNAREVALGFYENLGFKTIGDFYNIPKIGLHKLMYFELTNLKSDTK